MEKVENTNRLWVGVALILVGALFLLESLEIAEFGDIWRFWPLILVGVGVLKLTGSNFQDWAGAGVLIAIGLLLLAIQLDWMEWGDLGRLWPVFLIALGVMLIFRARRSGQPPKELATDRLDTLALFGGRKQVVASENFQGGSVTVLFGGSELDLRSAKLAKGRHVLDVFAMFGGAELIVPEDWNLVIRGVPIFGGFADNRPAKAAETETKNADTVLTVQGWAIFGGVEVNGA